MRFRVWDKNKGEFLAGRFTLSANGRQVFTFDDLKTLEVGRDCIVEFYTEFVDAKGTKICEGDILDGGYDDGLEMVYFDDTCWGAWAVMSSKLYDPMTLADFCDYTDGEITIVGSLYKDKKIWEDSK